MFPEMSLVSKLLDVVGEKAKHLVTRLFFKILDKNVILLCWLFGMQYQYQQTSTFRRKNKTDFFLNLAQN